MKSRFKFASVDGWPKSPPRGKMTDNQEISDVIAALTLLGGRAPADLDALDGVNLSRVSSIPGGWAGLTTVKSDGQAMVQLSDKIFENNAVQFLGGGARLTNPSRHLRTAWTHR